MLSALVCMTNDGSRSMVSASTYTLVQVLKQAIADLCGGKVGQRSLSIEHSRVLFTRSIRPNLPHLQLLTRSIYRYDLCSIYAYRKYGKYLAPRHLYTSRHFIPIWYRCSYYSENYMHGHLSAALYVPLIFKTRALSQVESVSMYSFPFSS